MKPVRFFCEFCNKEVRAADKVCPHCGSFFSQVRCQSCAFQGDYRLFVQGCPACGYAAPQTAKGQGAYGFEKVPWTVEELDGQKKTERKGTPSWVWVLLAILAAGLMVFTYLWTRRQ